MWRFVAVGWLFLSLIVVVGSVVGAETCDYPEEIWQNAALAEAGFDAQQREALEAVSEELPFLRSLLIVRHKCLVFERYFAEADAETLLNTFSITKSVTGLLIGMAIEEGAIAGVHDRIAPYLSRFTSNGLSAGRMTVNHLLKMLSGIDWNEDREIGGMLALDRSETAYILGLPRTYTHGERWNYSTADSHLLSAVLTGATEMSALEFAQSRLFDPLRIQDVRWTSDWDGINLGGTQLYLRSQDIARLGLLVLDRGNWDGDQLIPEDWITMLLRPQLSDPSAYQLSYAAHWWHLRLEDQAPMSAALGYGGQYIIIAPALDMVVVAMSNSYIRPPDRYISASQARQQEQAILDYLEERILISSGN